MAITSISPEVKSEIGYQIRTDRIFWTLVGIVFLLLAAFLGLKVYDTQLAGKVLTLQDKIEEIDKKRDLKLEKEMREKLPSLKTVNSLLNDHIRAKKIFDFLEENTLGNVQISSLSLDAKNNKLILTLTAKSSPELGMQASRFKANKNIKSVEIGGITITEKEILKDKEKVKEEEIEIQFALEFDPKMIRY